MKELAEAIRSIFDKIADFFDIFDLSFLVAGIATITAVLSWPPAREVARLQIRSTSAKFLLFFIGAYVAGLCCFAAGRYLRMGIFRKGRFERFDNLVETVLYTHNLDGVDPYKGYIERLQGRDLWRLYIRLWADARLRLYPSPTMSLLNRYWVLAATYDGVTVSLIAWFFLIVIWMLGLGFEVALNPWIGVPSAIVIVLLALACSREAGRYVKYQVEELIASIAASLDQEDRGQATEA